MSDLKINMQQELASLDFIAPGFTLNQFNGGTVNSSYKLNSADKEYFVKTFESDQISLLNRKNLFEIQQQLASQKLSPEPIYLSKCQNFQIDRWVDDPTLDKTKLSDLATCKILAATLAAIHKTEILVPKLDLPAHWHHYLQQMPSDFELPNNPTLEEMTERWHRACDKHSVFCHNDLATSHVTSVQPNLVFDWEYCALSSPYFDIASCIAVNGLNATDQASLCAHYAQCIGSPLSDIKSNVEEMKPIVLFTYKLWYQSASLMK